VAALLERSVHFQQHAATNQTRPREHDTETEGQRTTRKNRTGNHLVVRDERDDQHWFRGCFVL